MIHKEILPEGFDFGMPAVEMIGVGSKGLDKTAMVKRASIFDDVIGLIEKVPNRTYLHVITTGAHEYFSSNANNDSFNEASFDMQIPEPEDGKTFVITLDGGLKKYHDASYKNGGAVYQEHKTKRAGVEPSGEIVHARYNPEMHRGELIIAVDTQKWAPRLQRKANGKDLFLSIGCDVPRDLCSYCGRAAKTMEQHCDHFKQHRGKLNDSGERFFVMNDAPQFYDISGVDVPADRIAFVLQKIASGAPYNEAYVEAVSTLGTRTPMLLTKSAAALSKLSKIEKEIQCHIEGGTDLDNDECFKDSDEAKKDFIVAVKNYPSDEVIDCCNRKAILLSPEMLFSILGNDCEDIDSKSMLCSLDDSCCGDMSTIMQEFEEDDNRNNELLDGSFDQHIGTDLNLESILELFMPEFCTSTPAMNAKIIRITITGRPEKAQQTKEASFNKQAQDALKRTYARYLVSFAAQNDDATCMNALRKVAAYCK